MLPASRVGDRFDAICTGAADQGTWVRIFQPPIGGRLLYGFEGADVGWRLNVQPVRRDMEKRFIDFKKVQ
jgi:exoribonuclease-2